MNQSKCNVQGLIAGPRLCNLISTNQVVISFVRINVVMNTMLASMALLSAGLDPTSQIEHNLLSLKTQNRSIAT